MNLTETLFLIKSSTRGAFARPRRLPDFHGESNPSQAKRSEAKRSRHLSSALARPRRLPDFQGESNPSQAKRSEAKIRRQK